MIWQEGTTRLLDYGSATGSEAMPVLVVPSLVNRFYMLDLMAGRSLLRGWAERASVPSSSIGTGRASSNAASPRPITSPGGWSGRSTLSGPATAPRPPWWAIAWAAIWPWRWRCGAAPISPAWCCLATPWDFHAERPAHARLLATSAACLTPLLDTLGELPVDLLQALFAALDPFQVLRKFRAFAGLDASSERAEIFVALEDWLNDGVPLAASVARECLA